MGNAPHHQNGRQEPLVGNAPHDQYVVRQLALHGERCIASANRLARVHPVVGIYTNNLRLHQRTIGSAQHDPGAESVSRDLTVSFTGSLALAVHDQCFANLLLHHIPFIILLLLHLHLHHPHRRLRLRHQMHACT